MTDTQPKKRYRHWFIATFPVDRSTTPQNAKEEEALLEVARRKLNNLVRARQPVAIEYIETEDLEDNSSQEAVNYFFDVDNFLGGEK